MRLRKDLAAAGLATAAWAAPALAADRQWLTEGGVFVAVHFGTERPWRFGAGIQVRRVYAPTEFECGEPGGLFGGGVGRIEAVSWDQLRLVVGPQLGRRNPFTEIASELGLGYQLGREPGLVVQPGLEGAFLNLVTAGVSYNITRDFGLALGGRVSTGGAGGCYVVGRPLRRGDGRAPLPTALLVDGPSGSDARRKVDPRLDQAIALWAERAACEWSSVPAFHELTGQLAACGAPAELIARARAAADDELRHAVLAAGIAAQLAGQPVALEPPALDRRAPLPGRAGLLRLATESWTDGCLGEGQAAAFAAREAERSGVAPVRDVQRTIAADEARHAELAWDVLRWTLAVGPGDVRAAVAAADAQPRPTPVTPAAALADLAYLGCLPAGEHQEIADRSRSDAKARWQVLAP